MPVRNNVNRKFLCLRNKRPKTNEVKERGWMYILAISPNKRESRK